MYKNKYDETIEVTISDHNLLTTDNKSYGSINKIINPFDLNITKNNPYQNEEKNKSCFLEIKTQFDNILVVFKTEETPWLDYYYEINYNYKDDNYPDLFREGILKFHLLNNDNQLVLMFGTSIIILDIDTLEVLKYKSTNKIKQFGIKITYENNKYIVKDHEENITYFDKELNIIKK